MADLLNSEESELELGEEGARIVREETALPVPFDRPDATGTWRSDTATEIDLKYDQENYLWLEFVVEGVKYWTFDGSPIGIRKGMLFWPDPASTEAQPKDDCGNHALLCFGRDRIRVWMPSGSNPLDTLMTRQNSVIGKS